MSLCVGIQPFFAGMTQVFVAVCTSNKEDGVKCKYGVTEQIFKIRFLVDFRWGYLNL
jgi:hypothetical protein